MTRSHEDICVDVDNKDDLGTDPNWEGDDFSSDEDDEGGTFSPGVERDGAQIDSDGDDNDDDDDDTALSKSKFRGPVNRLAVAGDKDSKLGDKRWKNGDTLRVTFINGDKNLQKKVEKYAKEWEKHANIKFKFIYSEEDAKKPGDIRIMFGGHSSRSIIGTDAYKLPPSKATMHIGVKPSDPDKEIKRAALHEFGHALGAVHEHQSPASHIAWDEKKAIKFYSNYGLTEKAIKSKILDRYGEGDITNYTGFDKDSIMIYHIPKGIAHGWSVDWNYELSDSDKKFMEKMYPFPPPEKKKGKPNGNNNQGQCNNNGCTQPNGHGGNCNNNNPCPPPNNNNNNNNPCPPPNNNNNQWCPPPPPPPPPCNNICGDPTCGQTHICDADYNRQVQPMGYSGVDRSKPPVQPQWGCNPCPPCPPRYC